MITINVINTRRRTRKYTSIKLHAFQVIPTLLLNINFQIHYVKVNALSAAKLSHQICPLDVVSQQIFVVPRVYKYVDDQFSQLRVSTGVHYWYFMLDYRSSRILVKISLYDISIVRSRTGTRCLCARNHAEQMRMRMRCDGLKVDRCKDEEIDITTVKE